MTNILLKLLGRTTTLEVRESGTHATVKMTGNVTTLLSSCRGHIQPQKGDQNPPHIQHKANKGLVNMLKKK